MSVRQILYLCSECEIRFSDYVACLTHVCPTTVKVPTLEEFNTDRVVSEAYLNYKYVTFLYSYVLSFFPAAETISDICKKDKKAKALFSLIKKAEVAYRKGTRQEIVFPFKTKVEHLGILSYKSIVDLQKRSAFTASHLRLVYKSSPVYPDHYSLLWSKASFEFWPFFFASDYIFSEIFSSVFVRVENGQLALLTASGWKQTEEVFFFDYVCSFVIKPLFEDLTKLVFSCFIEKRFVLNSSWTDLSLEVCRLSSQLSSLFRGTWFSFYVLLPQTFSIFSKIFNIPVTHCVDDWINFDSIIKETIGPLSRGWIPFLCIFCDSNYVLEKYNQFL